MGIQGLSKKYKSAIALIVEQQSKVIGLELAYDLANSVDGLVFKSPTDLEITKNPASVLENLVTKYSVLFGKISIEVSKNAISKVSIKNEDLPESLRY